MHIDSGTLARTRLSSPGPVGLNEIEPNTALDNSKRELAFDIGQLILDITGIFDPSPVSDGTSFLISLARGNWFDAATSAVSIVPYIGDLAKTAKLPRYLESVRKAIQIARLDFKWAHALQALFEKLKKVLDKGYELSADLLPDAARKQLKALKDEIDDFLKPRGSAAGNPPEGGIKTKPQSSKPIKGKGDLEQPQPVGNLDKNATKGHGGSKNDDGPKKTPDPDPNKSKKAEKTPSTGPNRTKPSGKKGGKPRGERAPETGSQKRKHKRENESADTLADAGYDMDQGPHTKPNGKKPDYKIEDEYFDCLAPDTDSPDQVRKGISRKVKSGQTDRIILNLDDTNLKPSDITEILQRRPKLGLKEVIGIKKGKITQIFP